MSQLLVHVEILAMPDEAPNPDLVWFLQREFSITNFRAGVVPTSADIAGYAAKASWLGRGMTPGEVGCAIAHRRVLQRFLDGDSEWAIVIENDAIVENSKSVLASLSEYDKASPIVLMLGFNSDDVPTALARGKSFQIPSVPTGTYAYAINRPAAKRFLVETPFNYGPADWPPYGSAGTKFRILNPPIFKHPPQIGGHSRIHGRDSKIRRLQSYQTLVASSSKPGFSAALIGLIKLTVVRDAVRLLRSIEVRLKLSADSKV